MRRSKIELTYSRPDDAYFETISIPYSHFEPGDLVRAISTGYWAEGEHARKLSPLDRSKIYVVVDSTPPRGLDEPALVVLEGVAERINSMELELAEAAPDSD